METALDSIASSLRLITAQNVYWPIIITLPASILGALAVFIAAWASHHFSSKISTINATKAVLVEVKNLKEKIDQAISTPRYKKSIECRAITLNYKPTPIFNSCTYHIALSKCDQSKKILDFYISFLSIENAESENLYHLNDLENLSNLAKECIKEET